ncbi:MAG TPA: hypothetical protein PK149_08405, partial [Flavobacteriales bacterium]|nr:hypothetical protein [Flavobacteriales bacterium]
TGLREFVEKHQADLPAKDRTIFAEFVLHGLAEHSRIGRSHLAGTTHFGDLFSSMLSGEEAPDF